MVIIFSDVYDSVRKRKNKFIKITNIRNETIYDDCQIFIRAGMTDQLERLSRKHNLGFEDMKFVIHLRVNLVSSPKRCDVLNPQIIDQTKEQRETSNSESVLSFEDATTKINMDKTTRKLKSHDDIHIKKGGLFFRTSTLPLILEKQRNQHSSYNVTLMVNSLHLAIIARQKRSVQWIVSQILKEKHSDGEFLFSLRNILEDKVQVSIPDPTMFSPRDQILQGMNAFHLSSQYFPEALKMIFETLDANFVSPAKVLKSVRDDDNVFRFTPLHIAAKKSSLTAARY